MLYLVVGDLLILLTVRAQYLVPPRPCWYLTCTYRTVVTGTVHHRDKGTPSKKHMLPAIIYRVINAKRPQNSQFPAFTWCCLAGAVTICLRGIGDRGEHVAVD